MYDHNGFDEPPISPDDTHPTQTLRKVEMQGGAPPPYRPKPPKRGGSVWRRVLAVLALLVAGVVMLATALFLLLPEGVEVVPEPIPESTEVDNVVAEVPTSTPEQPPTEAPVEVEAETAETDGDTETVDINVLAVDALPTISAEQAGALLAEPLVSVEATDEVQIVRDNLNPFTIIPDRPRTDIVEHEIERGDTIYALAERYGIAAESIGWCNDRQLILALRPGRTLYIPPADGVCHRTRAGRSIEEIAAEYGANAYDVIDAEANSLFGADPSTVPASGLRLFIPGGEAEQIGWNPVVVREGGGDGGGGAGGGFISFAPGEPGSCGQQPNHPGSYWARPLNNYTFIRGFDGTHSGIDLSAPEGTPVAAANGGVVIFAGWNSYGYGYTVVLAHGAYTTLYGHLSSVGVGCGMVVGTGQIIGAVGNTGNSSGPHLHFEIRYLDQPTNPVSTIGF